MQLIAVVTDIPPNDLSIAARDILGLRFTQFFPPFALVQKFHRLTVSRRRTHCRCFAYACG